MKKKRRQKGERNHAAFLAIVKQYSGKKYTPSPRCPVCNAILITPLSRVNHAYASRHWSVLPDYVADFRQQSLQRCPKCHEDFEDTESLSFHYITEHIYEPNSDPEGREHIEGTRDSGRMPELSSWSEYQRCADGHALAMDQFCQRRWQEITSENRAFGIPPDGAATIEVSQDSLARLGLRQLQFWQEGYVAPAVGITLHYAGGSEISGSVNSSGDLALSINQRIPGGLHLILRATVLSYYSDLVTPHISASTNYMKANSPLQAGQVSGDAYKSIPRRSGQKDRPLSSGSGRPKKGTYVGPHRRLLREGWRASPGKIREAAILGVALTDPEGRHYTLVSGHQRGNADGNRVVYKHSSSRTVLDEFLVAIGL